LNEGTKHDQGKLPWQLVPWDAVRGVVKVLDFGAKKYAARNWEHGMDWSRLERAAINHITSWSLREDRDEETGLSHLFHAACCLLFLAAYEIRGTGKDDRPHLKPEPTPHEQKPRHKKVEAYRQREERIALDLEEQVARDLPERVAKEHDESTPDLQVAIDEVRRRIESAGRLCGPDLAEYEKDVRRSDAERVLGRSRNGDFRVDLSGDPVAFRRANAETPKTTPPRDGGTSGGA
jgi:hypothetical protein